MSAEPHVCHWHAARATRRMHGGCRVPPWGLPAVLHNIM